MRCRSTLAFTAPKPTPTPTATTSTLLYAIVSSLLLAAAAAMRTPPLQLNHDYYILRHGQSQANVAGIIASNPDIACTNYGLTSEGLAQAQAAGRTVVQVYQEQPNKYQGLLVVSSDLKRARETAQAVIEEARKTEATNHIPIYSDSNFDMTCSSINTHDETKCGVFLDTRLRERWFGDFDLTSDKNYQNVWNDDLKLLNNNNVESVDSVLDRALDCVMDWDKRLSATTANSHRYMVVCVAHGDVLQILQTAFSNVDVSHHRSLPHLETAQLRPLNQQL